MIFSNKQHAFSKLDLSKCPYFINSRIIVHQLRKVYGVPPWLKRLRPLRGIRPGGRRLELRWWGTRISGREDVRCKSVEWITSGKLTVCCGKLTFWMGESTISMAMFNSYVSLQEGNQMEVSYHGGTPKSSKSWMTISVLKPFETHGFGDFPC